ncbi:hypothetical protein IPC905_06865 [Pseudomonas aeruginosa]|nr:hypothetical protein Y880_0152002 [Pseudomonas aeruginosa PAK]KSI74153.1 hypothetical protein AO990_00800 [Pseudomonas aeruginosa]RMK91546.1 hypothetical protein IPC83_19140 [Pseudomonas aeruginosa]RPM48842.1 hypothetical protein IPC1291_10565 [Pseudomonas aeruginosa]RPU12671.1 hypothetical protein IPC908_03765 [Pseudomonas aeruginosa]
MLFRNHLEHLCNNLRAIGFHTLPGQRFKLRFHFDDQLINLDRVVCFLWNIKMATSLEAKGNILQEGDRSTGRRQRNCVQTFRRLNEIVDQLSRQFLLVDNIAFHYIKQVGCGVLSSL